MQKNITTPPSQNQLVYTAVRAEDIHTYTCKSLPSWYSQVLKRCTRKLSVQLISIIAEFRANQTHVNTQIKDSQHLKRSANREANRDKIWKNKH